MTIILNSASIITPKRTIENGSVIVSDDGRLLYVGEASRAPQSNGECIDAKDKIIAPGFIDIHVHGGKGVAFGMGDLAEGLSTYSKRVVSSGVTGFLCTITGPNADAIYQLIESYVPLFEKGVSGADALGFHLEGPFLNPQKKGAFNPSWLRMPDVAEAENYLKLGKGWVKQMTLAPELPLATEIAAYYRKAGVVTALGHSNTDYDTASAALRGDFTHVTHTFNAQSNFSHRAPGVMGAVMASDRITGELIGDGVHAHPAAMKILFRCLGSDRICLITDAIPGAGLEDGEYNLIGQHVTVLNGKATLDDGTIAGSTAQLNQCVNNMHNWTEANLAESVQMASLIPARTIGLENELGSLEEGKQANLIVIDKEVNVYLTMVRGKIVHNLLEQQ